jgi:hypothetical protein
VKSGDAAGLPLRQTIHLTFPPNGHEQVEATIKTDFSHWGERVIAAQGASGFLSLTPQELQRAVLSASLLGGLTGLMALLFVHRKSKKVYAGLALAVIASMVIAPPLQPSRSPRSAEQNAQRANVEQAQNNAAGSARFTTAVVPHSIASFAASLGACVDQDWRGRVTRACPCHRLRLISRADNRHWR